MNAHQTHGHRVLHQPTSVLSDSAGVNLSKMRLNSSNSSPPTKAATSDTSADTYSTVISSTSEPDCAYSSKQPYEFVNAVSYETTSVQSRTNATQWRQKAKHLTSTSVSAFSTVCLERSSTDPFSFFFKRRFWFFVSREALFLAAASMLLLFQETSGSNVRSFSASPPRAVSWYQQVKRALHCS